MGGNGVVFAGQELRQGRPVAVKLMLPLGLEDREQTARFYREVRVTQSIRSPHVVEVLDAGKAEPYGHYLVMERLWGADLAAILAARGQLPVQESVKCILQACEGLAAVHRCGVVHRDIKPANLFLSEASDGSIVVKLLDFGICKCKEDRSDQAARSASTLGSPIYMSPEQIASGDQVDQRADVWALGVVLFEMLAGGPPFRARAIPELFLKILNEPCESLETGGVPDGLIHVLEKCLQKRPAHRFRDVEGLSRALSPFAAHC